MASMLSVWCVEAAGAASQLSSCSCCVLQYKGLRGKLLCAGTYLDIGGGKWSKGVAFINGFNLV